MPLTEKRGEGVAQIFCKKSQKEIRPKHTWRPTGGRTNAAGFFVLYRYGRTEPRPRPEYGWCSDASPRLWEWNGVKCFGAEKTPGLNLVITTNFVKVSQLCSQKETSKPGLGNCFTADFVLRRSVNQLYKNLKIDKLKDLAYAYICNSLVIHHSTRQRLSPKTKAWKHGISVTPQAKRSQFYPERNPVNNGQFAN